MSDYEFSTADMDAVRRLRQTRRRDVLSRIAYAPFTGLGSLVASPLGQIQRAQAEQNFARREPTVAAIGTNEQYYYGQEQAARIEKARQAQAAVIARMQAYLQEKGIDANSAQARALQQAAQYNKLAAETRAKAAGAGAIGAPAMAYLTQLAQQGRLPRGARIPELDNASAMTQARAIAIQNGEETKDLATGEPSEYVMAVAGALLSQRDQLQMAQQASGVPAPAGLSPEEQAAEMGKIWDLAFTGYTGKHPGEAASQFMAMAQAVGVDMPTAVQMLQDQGAWEEANALMADDRAGIDAQQQWSDEADEYDQRALKKAGETYASIPELKPLYEELEQFSAETSALLKGARATEVPGVPGATLDASGRVMGPDGAPVMMADLPPETQQALVNAGYQMVFGVVAKPMGTQGEELQRSMQMLDEFPSLTPVRDAKEALMAGPVKAFMQAHSMDPADPDSGFREFMRQAKMTQRAARIVNKNTFATGVRKGMMPNVPKRLAGHVDDALERRDERAAAQAGGTPVARTAGLDRLAEAVARRSGFRDDDL